MGIGNRLRRRVLDVFCCWAFLGRLEGGVDEGHVILWASYRQDIIGWQDFDLILGFSAQSHVTLILLGITFFLGVSDIFFRFTIDCGEEMERKI